MTNEQNENYDEETELDFVDTTKSTFLQKITRWLKNIFTLLKK